MRKYFYSKILLFGEYTIVCEGEALAIPLDKFRGFWSQSDDKKRQQNLPAFAEFLSENDFPFLNITAFQDDLQRDVFFDSNIPTGYGAGSSGALVAAILDRYGDSVFLKNCTLSGLKNIAAQMESFFHGSSSGTDPLISFLNQPVYLKKEIIEAIEFERSIANSTFFLLDTRLPRSTEPLVKCFLKKMESAAFAEKVNAELKEHNRLAIQNFIQNQEKHLFENFEKISRFQFEYFQEMIPGFLKKAWQGGLQNDIFKLKICGAGGGGFMIGLTRDWSRTKKELADFPLIELKF